MRFGSKQEREFRCQGGPGNANVDQTIQGLAQQTAALPRPTLHLIDTLDASNPGMAYSGHIDQRVVKPWTSLKELSEPVTPTEKIHLRYMNQTLGTAFVGHNIRPGVTEAGGPATIDDPQLAVRMAHEMCHILGIPHDETEPPSFMAAAPGDSQEVNDSLCQKIRSSPHLRQVAPAKKSAPSDGRT